ncbi:MAG: hypothetical protein ACRERC_07115 [Candidatus Binatia bacterium]
MKRLLTTTLSLLSLAMVSGGAAYAACGNLNNDGGGAVNSTDAAILAQCAVGSCPTLPPPGICGTGNAVDCGDIFEDGVVDGNDVDALNTFITGGDPLYDICTGPGPNYPGCPGTVTLGTPAPTVINSNFTFPANCTLVLGGLVSVETDPGDPATVVRFAPGSIVKGATGTTTSNPAALIFGQGSRIDAIGSPSTPIIFTSTAAPGSRTKGDWGGVVFNGNGTVNGPGCTFQSEGLPFSFGGCEDDYNAGFMTFTRFEFAGLDFTTNNELNLLTMNGLGTQTNFNFIQANVGDDDCLEWFGGTSNHKNMIASGCGDDGFDYQLGYTGSLQFGLMLQDGTLTDTTPSRDSRGIEADNSEFDQLASPVTRPTMCNLTLIGGKNQPAANVGSDSGILMRRGLAGQFANLIVTGFEDSCIEIRDRTTANLACIDNNADEVADALTGNLVIRNSIAYDCGSTVPPVIGTEMAKSGTIAGEQACTGAIDGDCACQATASFYALLPSVVNANAVAPTVDPGVNDQFPGIDNTGCTGAGVPFNCCTGAVAGFCRAVPDEKPAIVGPAPAAATCSTINPLFSNPAYLGAINPGAPACTATQCDWISKPWAEFATN